MYMAQDADHASLAVEAMVTRPSVHGPSATVAQLRAFFTDDHMHAALLAEGSELIGVVERPDLTPDLGDDALARTIATLDGRTIRPDVRARDALEAMKCAGRRRLAVVGDDGSLLGLLCLNARGDGFCSDADVRSRRLPRN
jgi:CBS domain-containing protein